MAGPVGMAVGAVVGGVVGGLAGKGVAESIDPTTEDAYWRENHTSRPYYDAGHTYDDYAPAYRYGWESRSRHADRNWDEVETDLARGWDIGQGQVPPHLGPRQARHPRRLGPRREHGAPARHRSTATDGV